MKLKEYYVSPKYYSFTIEYKHGEGICSKLDDDIISVLGKKNLFETDMFMKKGIRDLTFKFLTNKHFDKLSEKVKEIIVSHKAELVNIIQ